SSRRRHTRFKCDWSSDVCSSDLDVQTVAAAHLEIAQYHVEVAVVQPLDGGVAVRGFFDFVSRFGKTARQPAAERVVIVGNQNSRSEERRVGKECRSRWWVHSSEN